MNTSAAATQAGVTIPTIRNWCRLGVITAVKQAGRWIIDAASLARRITIGKERRRMTDQPTITPDLNGEFSDVVTDSAYQAADVGSPSALKQLLGWIQTRDITAVMGNIDTRRVQLTDAEWAGLERLVRLQAGCLSAEH